MKKLITVITILALAGALLTGCSGKDATTGSDQAATPTEKAKSVVTEAPNAATTAPTAEPKEIKTITVGASSTPHAEILEQIKPILKEGGYELKIVVYQDYVQPNVALDNGDLDANYFQHQPYLDQYNEENGTELISVGSIHYEPFGIYPGKIASIDELKSGSLIAVPNDATNEARALLLLEAQGIITLKEGIGLNATKNDIAGNPKNIEIVELEAAQIARSLPDVELAVINGNYAIEAGLNVAEDAIAVEDKESVAAQTYGNIVAVKSGNEGREDIKALITALQSDVVKQYIDATYQGAVVPIF